MIKTRLDEIVQGETLKILRTLGSDSFDVGVTSPPYNKQEKNNGWLVKNVQYDTYKDTETEEKYQKNQVEVLDEIFRVTKEGGSFFYNHKTRWDRGHMIHPMEWLRKTKWTVRQEIIWDRMIAANIRGWRFWQTDERIYWLYKPIATQKIGREIPSRHALLTSVWRFPPERDNPHPAPFPIVLPLRCIYSILDEKRGAAVLDPYMGSGSTAVAAKLLGQNYFGIDISKEYVGLAKKRLSNIKRYADVLNEEIGRHVVKKNF
jgi:modification methylase